MENRSVFHPRQILCPVDMSELSDLALKYAHAGASVFDADLIVLHAMHFEYPRYLSSDLTDRVLVELNNAKQTVQHEVQAHVRSVLGQTDIQKASIRYQVTDSQPAEAAMQAVADHDIDLVVMGTHGYSGIKHWMLGSVTENVIRQCPVPVFIVRQKIDDFIDTTQPDSRPRIDHILCPCNLTEAAAQALKVAGALARRFGARLIVVRVEEAGARPVEDLAVWSRTALGDTANTAGIDIVTQSGPAAEQIIRLAKEKNCDLIVIGAHHKPFEQARVMGRTTELVLRHAPVPVLAVPFLNEKEKH